MWLLLGLFCQKFPLSSGTILGDGYRIKEYTTDDENLFQQLQLGSTWTLEINTLGAIVSIQPK